MAVYVTPKMRIDSIAANCLSKPKPAYKSLQLLIMFIRARNSSEPKLFTFLKKNQYIRYFQNEGMDCSISVIAQITSLSTPYNISFSHQSVGFFLIKTATDDKASLYLSETQSLHDSV